MGTEKSLFIHQVETVEAEATDEVVSVPGFLEQRYPKTQNYDVSWGGNRETPHGERKASYNCLGMTLGENWTLLALEMLLSISLIKQAIQFLLHWYC